ncbi:MAG TPA: hypothetical protein VFO60_01790 [Candidatus Dormibacteraeota bacterium]|nr:hypothetical protein [Candidatus Dormibacteraeota bacterium]
MRMATVHGAGAVVLAAAALAAAGCGSSSSSSSSSAAAVSQGPACDTTGSLATATTATYKMVLDVGEPEQMYSSADVSANHPTTGEVMLGGVMSMATGPNARHVEVHICKASTGEVVVSANPTITLTDTAAAGSTPAPLEVSEMQGVTSGQNDYHYGNNAVLAIGHAYTVTVTLNGETATMNFTAA